MTFQSVASSVPPEHNTRQDSFLKAELASLSGTKGCLNSLGRIVLVWFYRVQTYRRPSRNPSMANPQNRFHHPGERRLIFGYRLVRLGYSVEFLCRWAEQGNTTRCAAKSVVSPLALLAVTGIELRRSAAGPQSPATRFESTSAGDL